MRLFKEEQVKEIFNDATIITTKKYFYYQSLSRKPQSTSVACG